MKLCASRLEVSVSLRLIHQNILSSVHFSQCITNISWFLVVSRGVSWYLGMSRDKMHITSRGVCVCSSNSWEHSVLCAFLTVYYKHLLVSRGFSRCLGMSRDEMKVTSRGVSVSPSNSWEHCPLCARISQNISYKHAGFFLCTILAKRRWLMLHGIVGDTKEVKSNWIRKAVS